MSAEEVLREWYGLLRSASATLRLLSDECVPTSSPAVRNIHDDIEAALAPYPTSHALASLVPAVPSEGLTEEERAEMAELRARVDRFVRWSESIHVSPETGRELRLAAGDLGRALTVIDRLSASVPAVGPGEVEWGGKRYRVVLIGALKAYCQCPDSHRHGAGGGGCECCLALSLALVPITPPEDSPEEEA